MGSAKHKKVPLSSMDVKCKQSGADHNIDASGGTQTDSVAANDCSWPTAALCYSHKNGIGIVQENRLLKPPLFQVACCDGHTKNK